MHLASQLICRHSTKIFRNKWFKYNITGLKTPIGRRQPVGYLQAWPRNWTRDDRAQIQQVARAGLEPGTAGLRVRRADHSAALPSVGIDGTFSAHFLSPWPLLCLCGIVHHSNSRCHWWLQLLYSAPHSKMWDQMIAIKGGGRPTLPAPHNLN